MILMINDCIMIIPDIHSPYHHKDTIPFLKAIKKKYKPTRVINLGDEVDGHSWSFHQASAELDSPSKELDKAIEFIGELADLFPTMDLMESNHGSLFIRKMHSNHLPIKILKGYGDILETPKTWKWHDRLIVTLPNKTKCLFVHSLGSNVLKVSQSMGMSVVEGHHHSQFELTYWGNGFDIFFGMVSACLIDDKSLAFAYNKLTVKRPMLGASIIKDSTPHLIPMRVDKNNRWIGDF
jgi:hypothetical protein